MRLPFRRFASLQFTSSAENGKERKCLSPGANPRLLSLGEYCSYKHICQRCCLHASIQQMKDFVQRRQHLVPLWNFPLQDRPCHETGGRTCLGQTLQNAVKNSWIFPLDSAAKANHAVEPVHDSATPAPGSSGVMQQKGGIARTKPNHLLPLPIPHRPMPKQENQEGMAKCHPLHYVTLHYITLLSVPKQSSGSYKKLNQGFTLGQGTLALRIRSLGLPARFVPISTTRAFVDPKGTFVEPPGLLSLSWERQQSPANTVLCFPFPWFQRKGRWRCLQAECCTDQGALPRMLELGLATSGAGP